MSAALILVVLFGLWAAAVSIVALIRGDQIRDDRETARRCLADLIHLAEMHDQAAGEPARHIAARYDPALRNLQSRSPFREVTPRQAWTVDPSGHSPLSAVTEGETWMDR